MWLSDMGMDQYLLIPFLGGWTSIYQLFWCSPGVQGFDTLPYTEIIQKPSIAHFFYRLKGNSGSRSWAKVGHDMLSWLYMNINTTPQMQTSMVFAPRATLDEIEINKAARYTGARICGENHRRARIHEMLLFLLIGLQFPHFGGLRWIYLIYIYIIFFTVYVYLFIFLY